MKLNEIKELIDKIDDSNIAYFEVKLDDGYVKMDKSLTRNFSEEKKQTTSTVGDEVTFKKKEVSEYNGNSEYSIEEKFDNGIFDEDVYYITSPMVGTFYSSPGTNQEAYVKVGDKVNPGDILCIVEAMKLMNEIECEVSGEVLDIVATNGKMVEYGEQLFKIRRD